MQKLKMYFKEGPKPFKVCFIGDDETDGNGPLREFFHCFF